MVELSRRKILQLAAFGLASRMLPFGTLNAFAATTGDLGAYQALVCVFLFGGNDSNNMVVPINGQARTDYEASRTIASTLQLDALSLLDLGSANYTMPDLSNVAGNFGLHPSMTHLHGLRENLAVIPNVGTLVTPLTKDQYRNKLEPIPRALFSHSDQQRQLQTASPLAQSGTGWGGRLADCMQGGNASSAFPTSVSLSGSNVWLTGSASHPVTLSAGSRLLLNGSTGTSGAARHAGLQELLNFDTGFSLVQQASTTLSQGIETGNVINAAVDPTTTLATPFPATSLGRQLEHIAKLIKVRDGNIKRQIFFCSTGGFDTHSDQVAKHAGLMGGLSESMAAFYQATVELGVANQVTSFTQSDFNRTFQPNPTFGSDHAWGGHHVVLGGSVRKGFFGDFPNLQLNGPSTTDSRGRWIPTTGMDQYGATLPTWFGLPSGDLNIVFPNLGNFPTANLGFV
jgi:uncharacterized protein (DUF1501 family)